MTTESSTCNTHPAFEFRNAHYIDSLNVTVEHYEHKVTGAAHYHLAADDPQNVFMVALRTVPMDSTGVAHILEHTVLCGSEKYPVRDPFFMMIRRSLNTFMNAFTSSDWTAYPFATENRKDFQNLLQVYMDAVFFPNIDELDFAQEGHRFEFSEMTNSESDLTYKGVVFNEMKGAMSSPVSTLWQTLTEVLYPTSTYHYNSGGEPVDIPDLSYQQLVDFHTLHYHPSNSVFMTYGDIPAVHHQTQFETLALSRFEGKFDQIHVNLETRYTEAKVVEAEYALDEEDTEGKTHIVLAWLLGQNQDPLNVLRGHLLSAVLLDNSASPLRQVLEATDLANAPSPLLGFEESNKEMAFVVGVQGSEPEHAQAVEELIMTELHRIADEGVEQSQVEAMLHQLELGQREVGGDGYPYGLQLILHALAGAMHEGDPIALLDVDSALKSLESEVASVDFIPGLVKTLLLDNPHRVRLTMKPDSGLSAKTEQEELARLATIQAGLDESSKQAIIDMAVALETRQAQEDDPSILPEVTKADIPTDIKQYTANHTHISDMLVTGYECGTNGLTYQQILVDLPELSEQEKQLMPIFNGCITEVGSAGRDFLQTQSLQAAVTGGLSARSSIHSKQGDANGCHSHFVLSSKALNGNQKPMTQLLNETLNEADFSDTQRLNDLISQIRASVDQGVTGSGHSQAMMAATQNMSSAAKWKFERTGFKGIQTIKKMYDSITAGDLSIEVVAEQLQGIQHKVAGSNRQALLISDEQGMASATQAMASVWDKPKTVYEGRSFGLSTSKDPVKEAWITSTQVNFCALAYPAVMIEHEDAPKLAVLGACLRNGFLHATVREKGGAYGGGASYNAEAGAFVFYSYRDPRLMETFEDFKRAKEWLMSADATQAKVDEAILNVISSMDKPGSPAGEMKKAFLQTLYGRTHTLRMAYRSGVISTTLGELRDVAEKYLTTEDYSSAVLTNAGTTELLQDNGFKVNTL